MNLPNKLTLARLGFTVAFMVALFVSFPYHHTMALLLFVLGSLTDHLDGRLARRYNMITNFGKLMDPLADKIFTCSAFIAFVGLKLMPAWMVVVIVAREFAITGLRTLAATQNRILAAEGFGKHKTVSQIICIIAMLVSLCVPEWGWLGKWFIIPLAGVPWVFQLVVAMQWVTVALTIISGTLYLWRNHQMFTVGA